LRTEAPVEGPQQTKVTVSGRPDSGSSWMSANSVWVVRLQLTTEGSQQPFSYTCDHPVSATSLLCTSTVALGLPEDGLSEPWGNVALATVDLAARVVTLEEIMPPSKTSVSTMVMSPDGRELFLRTGNGWVRADRHNRKPPLTVVSQLPVDRRTWMPELTWL
jgi:hypothetical protein